MFYFAQHAISTCANISGKNAIFKECLCSMSICDLNKLFTFQNGVSCCCRGLRETHVNYNVIDFTYASRKQHTRSRTHNTKINCNNIQNCQVFRRKTFQQHSGFNSLMLRKKPLNLRNTCCHIVMYIILIATRFIIAQQVSFQENRNTIKKNPSLDQCGPLRQQITKHA